MCVFPPPSVITYKVVINTDKWTDTHSHSKTQRNKLRERERDNILGYRETLYMCLSIYTDIYIYRHREINTLTHTYMRDGGEGGREGNEGRDEGREKERGREVKRSCDYLNTFH